MYTCTIGLCVRAFRLYVVEKGIRLDQTLVILDHSNVYQFTVMTFRRGIASAVCAMDPAQHATASTSQICMYTRKSMIPGNDDSEVE